ncbi:MXAN_6640 family putative metalloprotease [candidate division KSB1 bacterium]
MIKIITFTFSILLLLCFNNIHGSELSVQISEEYKAGNISYHQYLVHRGYMLFDQEKLQTIYPGIINQQAIKSGTGIIMELNNNWNILSSEEQSFFAKQLARPVLQNSIISPGEAFKVHFDTTGANSVPMQDIDNNGIPDYVEIAAASLDTSLYTYVNELGYRPPAPDGDGIIDVYLVNLGNIYGETVYLPDVYMRIENDFTESVFYTQGINALRVTCAHELHHAIQLRYTLQSSEFFFYEITSTYYEDYVFTYVNDYYQYLPSFFNNTDMPFNTYNGWFEYGNCLFGHFLEKKIGKDVLRKTWEQMAYSRTPIVSLNNVLNSKGTDFNTELAEYAVWNYFTGSRADTTTYYNEGKNYPEIDDITDVPLGQDTTILLDIAQISSKYINFTNVGTDNYRISLIDETGHDFWESTIFAQQDFKNIDYFTKSIILPKSTSLDEVISIVTSTAKSENPNVHSGKYKINARIDRDIDKQHYSYSEPSTYSIVHNADIIPISFSDKTSLIVRFTSGQNKGKSLTATNFGTQLPDDFSYAVDTFTTLVGYIYIGSDITGEFSADLTISYSDSTLSAVGIPESDLTAVYYDTSGSAWRTLNVSIDAVNNYMKTEVQRFPLIALVNKNDPLIKPVAVHISTFAYEISTENEINLYWQAENESNIYGYEVEKSVDGTEFISIGYIPKENSGNNTYRIVDTDSNNRKNYYRIKILNIDGSYSYSRLLSVANSQHFTFRLLQNYPNPFNARTIIKYELPVNGFVSLKIYSTNGQLIKTLINRNKSVGFHQAEWDGTNDNHQSISSGIYLYRLNTGSRSLIKKMIYLK